MAMTNGDSMPPPENPPSPPENPPAQPAESPARPGQLTATELTSTVNDGYAAAAAYLPVAVEMIKRYLGEDDYAKLPVAIENECIVRIAGHGLQNQGAAVTQDVVGPRSISYPDDRRGLLKRCGAESLLSPYKTRGAGVIE